MDGPTAIPHDMPMRRISRRSFLRAASVGAAGLAAAPWLPDTPVLAVQDATPVPVPSDLAWSDLANRLRGRFLRPGDPMYPAATMINATRYAGVRPDAIAVCVVPEDAAACVWQHAYYGQTFDRLVEIKRTWDPDNLFRYGQSIPVG